MAEAASPSLRVALIAEAQGLRSGLRSLLESKGLQVVFDHRLQDWESSHLGGADMDVLLVDLDEAKEKDLARLDSLIDASPVPILFNMTEGVLDRESGEKLVAKLFRLAKTRLAGSEELARRETEAGEFLAPVLNPPRAKPNLRVVSASPEPSDNLAKQVWVLGASLGGPKAIGRFLDLIPADLPVSFIVVQHIAPGHLSLLAGQLNRRSAFAVSAAKQGALLGEKQVVLVPGNERFSFSDTGAIELLPERRSRGYSPSIDAVMATVAGRYGDKSGAIIFSGMGDDGVRGSHEIAQRGGQVWAQDEESCLFCSMPNSARERGPVHYSGAPEQLAERLIEQVRSQTASSTN